MKNIKNLKNKYQFQKQFLKQNSLRTKAMNYLNNKIMKKPHIPIQKQYKFQNQQKFLKIKKKF